MYDCGGSGENIDNGHLLIEIKDKHLSNIQDSVSTIQPILILFNWKKERKHYTDKFRSHGTEKYLKRETIFFVFVFKAIFVKPTFSMPCPQLHPDPEKEMKPLVEKYTGVVVV